LRQWFAAEPAALDQIEARIAQQSPVAARDEQTQGFPLYPLLAMMLPDRPYCLENTHALRLSFCTEPSKAVDISQTNSDDG
jgi:hypothetical protein